MSDASQEPTVLIKISFEDEELAGHYRPAKMARVYTDRELSWVMQVPESVVGRGRHDYPTAIIERVTGEEKTLRDGDTKKPPLTPSEWRLLRLALDGVNDRTVPPEVCREGVVDREEWECLWGDAIRIGNVTTVAAESKGGKSTWLRQLLTAGSTADGDTFLGVEANPFNSLVVTEEAAAAWRNCPRRCRIDFVRDDPISDPERWASYVAGLGILADEYGTELVVLDTISRVSAHEENSAVATTRMMAPLRRLAKDREVAVLVLHHTGRSGTVRGSTALEAQSDAVIRISRMGEDITDRRRCLEIVSRTALARRIDYTMDADGGLVLWSPSRAPAVLPALNPFAKRGA